VEVMVSVAISAIIIFGIFSVLQASNRQLQIIHAKMTLQERLREALFKMTQEIRQAPQKVDANRITLTDGHLTDGIYDNVADGDDGTTDGVAHSKMITFNVPDAASMVVDDAFELIGTTEIQYRRGDPDIEGESESQLFRIATDPAGEKKQAILASDVTSLVFSRKITTPTLITIILEAQKELPDGRTVTVQMTAQAEARNP